MYTVDPFGTFRDDYHAAQISHSIARAHFKPVPPLKAFMFKSKLDQIAELDVEQSEDDMRLAMRGFGRPKE